MRQRLGAMPKHIVVDFPRGAITLRCTCGELAHFEVTDAASIAATLYNPWRSDFIVKHEKCVTYVPCRECKQNLCTCPLGP